MPVVRAVEVDGATCSIVEDTIAWDSESPDREFVRKWQGPGGTLVATYVSRAAEPLDDAVRSRLEAAVVEGAMVAGDLWATKDELRRVAARVRDVHMEADSAVLRVNGHDAAGFVVTAEGLRVAGALVNGAMLTVVAGASSVLDVSVE